jgi:hypothetical protein
MLRQRALHLRIRTVDNLSERCWSSLLCRFCALPAIRQAYYESFFQH